MRCKHCHKAPVSRPRGLCWVCFYTPSIRRKYPAKNVARGPKDRNGHSPLPPWPTKANPGSREKIRVMRQRNMLRVQLWHPDDGPGEGELK